MTNHYSHLERSEQAHLLWSIQLKANNTLEKKKVYIYRKKGYCMKMLRKAEYLPNISFSHATASYGTESQI